MVRPVDRSVGKFGIRWSRPEMLYVAFLYVAFFSRELNYWNKSAYFAETADLLAEKEDEAFTRVPSAVVPLSAWPWQAEGRRIDAEAKVR